MVTTAAVRRLLLLRKVLALHEVQALRIRGSWELMSAVNRRPLRAIRAAGFSVDDVQAFQNFDTMYPTFPTQRIRAIKPS